MRKVVLAGILSVTLLFVGQIALSQGKQAQRAEAFTDKAAEKFDLNNKAQNKVYELQLAKIKQNAKWKKQVKEGVMTREEVKPLRQAYDAEFLGNMANATGKSKKEIRMFLKELRQEQKTNN